MGCPRGTSIASLIYIRQRSRTRAESRRGRRERKRERKERSAGGGGSSSRPKMGEGYRRVRTFLPLVRKQLYGVSWERERKKTERPRRWWKDERGMRKDRGRGKEFLLLLSSLFAAASHRWCRVYVARGFEWGASGKSVIFFPLYHRRPSRSPNTPILSTIYMRVPSRAAGGERTRGESPFDLGTHWEVCRCCHPETST